MGPEHRCYLTDLKNDLFCLAADEIQQWSSIKRIEQVHTVHRSEIQRRVGTEILRRQFAHLPFKKALAAVNTAANAALEKTRETSVAADSGDSNGKSGNEGQQVKEFYACPPNPYMDEEHQNNISQMAVIFADVTTDEFIEVVMQEEAEDVTTRFGFVQQGTVLVNDDRPLIEEKGPFDRDKKGQKNSKEPKRGTGGVLRSQGKAAIHYCENDDECTLTCDMGAWVLQTHMLPKRILYFVGTQACMTPVQPPSAYLSARIPNMQSLMLRSGRLPEESAGSDGDFTDRTEVGLKLEHVHGYRGDHPSQNLYVNVLGEVCYYTAATAVVLDTSTKKHVQRFFCDHNEDITSMCMKQGGKYVATGQIKGTGIGNQAKDPFVIVWDCTSNPPKQLSQIGAVKLEDLDDTYRQKWLQKTKLHKTGSTLYTTPVDSVDKKYFPFYERAVSAIAFQPDEGATLLVAAGEDHNHTLGLWDWTSGRLIDHKPSKKGTPWGGTGLAPGDPDPVLCGISWRPAPNKNGPRVWGCDFVTYGNAHLSFWEVVGQGYGRYSRKMCNHGAKDVCGPPLRCGHLTSMKAKFKSKEFGEHVQAKVVHAVTWSPGGSLIAGGEGRLKHTEETKKGWVWVFRVYLNSGGDMDGGLCTHSFPVGSGIVNCVYIDPNFRSGDAGGVLFTGGDDGKVRRWLLRKRNDLPQRAPAPEDTRTVLIGDPRVSAKPVMVEDKRYDLERRQKVSTGMMKKIVRYRGIELGYLFDVHDFAHGGGAPMAKKAVVRKGQVDPVELAKANSKRLVFGHAAQKQSAVTEARKIEKDKDDPVRGAAADAIVCLVANDKGDLIVGSRCSSIYKLTGGVVAPKVIALCGKATIQVPTCACEDLANGHNGTLDGLAAWPWMRLDSDSMDEGDLDQDPLGHGGPFYLTTGSDARLCMWDPSDNNLCAEALLLQVNKKKRKMYTGLSVGISYTGEVCCVGTESFGMICLLKLPKLPQLEEPDGEMVILKWKKVCADEEVSVVKFSPNDQLLAVGTHANSVIIISPMGSGGSTSSGSSGSGSTESNNSNSSSNLRWRDWLDGPTHEIQVVSRFEGHSSYLLSVDWSADSGVIMSQCAARELIYWNPNSGKKYTSTFDTVEADTDWSTWSGKLGFPVMGIWPDGATGNDVNCVVMDRKREYVATSDDFGLVKLFHAPCLVEDAPYRIHVGHSSHVQGVAFLQNLESPMKGEDGKETFQVP